MKRYRRRFIQFNMLFVSFILLVVFVALSVAARPARQRRPF